MQTAAVNESEERGGGSGWGSTALLFGGFLALYLLSSQDAFYRNDAGRFVRMLISDSYGHPYHVLYAQFLRLVKALTSPLGLTPFAVATLCSALGTALGVALLHRAARYYLAARAAVLAAALCGVVPAVWFFATVVEVHGAFMAPVGLAWWAVARLERRALARRALACGAATGLAAAFHGTGQLLPLLVLAWWLGGSGEGGARGRCWPRLWPRSWSGEFWVLGALLAVVHVGVSQAVIAAMRGGAAGAGGPPDQLARFLELAAEADRLELLPQTLLFEWLLPFAPFSATWLLALRSGAARPRGMAVLLAVLAYVGCAFLLLEMPRERGAYLLPLVFPAVVLSLRRLAMVPALYCGVLAAGLAVSQIVVHGRDPEGVGFVADMRAAVAGESPFVFVGPRVELNGVTRDWHDLPHQPIHELLIHEVPAEAAALYYRTFDAYLARLWTKGHVVYLTRGAVNGLVSTPGSSHDKLYREHLQVRYRLAPVNHGAFHAFRIEPR